jgi:hypothetical protein
VFSILLNKSDLPSFTLSPVLASSLPVDSSPLSGPGGG